MISTNAAVFVFGNRLRALLLTNLDGIGKTHAEARVALAARIQGVSAQLRRHGVQEFVMTSLFTFWPFLRTKLTYVRAPVV